MNKQIDTIKVILLISLAIALVFTSVSLVSNSTLKNRIKGELIKSETLLSEKLQLDKTITSLKADLNALKGKNTDLDRTIADLSVKLSKKEAEIQKTAAKNASLADLKKQIAELEQMKAQLKEEVASLTLANGRLKDENEKMKNENEKLYAANEILKSQVTDNYRVEALRGRKDKLTAAARKTDKLFVSFDLPDKSSESVTFKIVTPEGIELSSADQSSMAILIREQKPDFLAATDKSMLLNNPRRVEMYYSPGKKLSKGVYQFNLYNEGNYLGSTQLRLK